MKMTNVYCEETKCVLSRSDSRLFRSMFVNRTMNILTRSTLATLYTCTTFWMIMSKTTRLFKNDIEVQIERVILNITIVFQIVESFLPFHSLCLEDYISWIWKIIVLSYRRFRKSVLNSESVASLSSFSSKSWKILTKCQNCQSRSIANQLKLNIFRLIVILDVDFFFIDQFASNAWRVTVLMHNASNEKSNERT